ncbi:ABC superfamily ATP binding cassette transporter, ABC domain protein [Mycobacterium xenopi 3993]|nr:ABC superfamily ATP binding cassette transporter, ABC domain protein [Mycobacterium xenopi 3993]
MRHHCRVPETASDAVDPDLLIDFRNVSLRRDGRVLVGPVDWKVELDERWVIVGPTGRARHRCCGSPPRPSTRRRG